MLGVKRKMLGITGLVCLTMLIFCCKTTVSAEELILDGGSFDSSGNYISEELYYSEDPEAPKHILREVEEQISEPLAETAELVTNIEVKAAGPKQVKSYGVDVSSWQYVDTAGWTEAKAAGVDFAIIRVGFRGSESGRIIADNMAKTHIEGALAAGLDVGLYFYSTSISVEEAVEEAKWVVDNWASKYDITYPIVFDFEGYWDSTYRNYKMSAEDKTDNAIAFLYYIQNAGYKPMMYESAGHLGDASSWKLSRLEDDFRVWVAQYWYYGDGTDRYPTFKSLEGKKTYYEHEYVMWQASDMGIVSGIYTNSKKTALSYVDLDVEYFNDWDNTHMHVMLSENGKCAHVCATCGEKEKAIKTNGDACLYKCQTIFNGLERDSAGNWWYCRHGRVDTSYTGLAKNDWGWWYVSNGQLDRSYTGLAKNDWGWWYVKNGQLDRSYTGLAKNDWGWWYVSNGQLDRSYTGLAKNDWGWWYVSNGQLDRSYTGLAKNDWGWWYCENGRIVYSFSGNYNWNGHKTIVKNGHVISGI